MSPPLTGRAFELRSAGEPHFSALLQSAEAVCKNLEWTGLASFDFVLDEDGQFRFVDFNPRPWGSVDATLTAGVDLYGGIDRWIRCGNAGPPTRSVPGISHRVFPAYTLEPSDMSLWRRLMGLRDAPRGALSLAVGELARELDERVRRAVPLASPGRLRSLHLLSRRAINPDRGCGKPGFTSRDADPSPGQSFARRPWSRPRGVGKVTIARFLLGLGWQRATVPGCGFRARRRGAVPPAGGSSIGSRDRGVMAVARREG